MRDYILSIISVSLLGGMANALCPSGNAGKIKKSVSLIMSLLLVCAVARPLTVLIEKGGNIDLSEFADKISEDSRNYNSYMDRTVETVISDSAEEYIYAFAAEEYGLYKEDISVDVKTSSGGNDISFETINLTLHAGAIFKNPRRLEVEISELFGCECNVYEEWEG
ncbi:MAG: hypothetical protein U0M06_13765 [Clostridia bacterium]|nr:hypothetical protein [Clostridia bacterium]